MNNFNITCDHCESEYNPDEQGTMHDFECECCYCDPDHDEYIDSPIPLYLEKFGFLEFCCMECEANWIKEGL